MSTQPNKIERIPISAFSKRCLDQIEETVASKLKSPEKIEGLQLLTEILDSDSSHCLNIVTLNHDLLVETYLQNYGILDGFHSESDDLEVFDSNAFKNTSGKRVSILKPHGSINWYRFKKRDGSDFCGKCLSNDPDHLKNRKGESIDPPTGRLLLAGTTNKELSYGSGVFLEILFQFHAMLKRTEILVTSGYGFKDKGINNRIWAWLDNNELNRLIIMHEDKEKLFSEAKYSLKSNYDRFSETSKIRFIDKWMCSTTLEELEIAMRNPDESRIE